MKENHEIKIPQLCILTKSQFAQSLHKELTKLELLNRRFQAWHSIEDSLVGFPLTRSLSSKELHSLRNKVNQDLAVDTLELLKSHATPRSISEALEEAEIKIPPDLLEFIPRAIDMIGDIGIIELENEVLPYSKAIGDAFLQVNPRLKTIFQKASPIKGVHRTRRFLHLAGVPRSVTTYVENGVSLEIDIEKVYFSPRLSTERRTVVNQVLPDSNELIFDMFAGVGPFSIALAKRGVQVIAVDINPDAINLLRENAKTNGVQELIEVYVGDVRTLDPPIYKEKASRVIMNLPFSALDYLDIALLSLRPEGGMIHFYCFVKGENSKDNASRIFQEGIENSGGKVVSLTEVRRVKQTAPDEWQIAVDAQVQKKK
ncbi:MAG: class I SAM-dependent methyltransferase [Candidatus Ranarchaeia archaeon]